MTRKELGYVELEWTCKHCGTINPGMRRTCSNCGAPIAQDDKFELPGQQQLITDKEKLEEARAGPAIHCPYCNVLNPAGTRLCIQCGGDIEAGLKRQAGEVLGAYQATPAPDITCPSCGQVVKAGAERCPNCGGSLAGEKSTAKPLTAPTAKKPPLWMIVGGITLGVLCLAGVIAFIVLSGRTNEVTATITDLRWQRSIEILAQQPVQHSAWEEDLPAAAQGVACRDDYKETSSEPVPDATETCGTPYTVDTGSGAGQVVQDCEYLVYASYCDFTTLDLVVIDTAQALGSDSSPYWPVTNLVSGQQEGGRTETYRATFTAGDETYAYTTPNNAEFSQFSLGAQWVLEVNTFGNITDMRLK